MAYYLGLNETLACSTKDIYIAIGVVFIRYKCCLSDEKTILQIQVC